MSRLIDEYQLLVHPLILGSGKHLWGELEHPVNLKPLRTEAFKNGVVMLYDEPERN